MPDAKRTVECWVELGTEEGRCWLMQDLHSEVLRDAAELPAGAADHDERIEKGLWGPRWSRLCPCQVIEASKPVARVKLLSSKAEKRVRAGRLLPWYEGLLILDAMQRQRPQPQWLEDILPYLTRDSRRLRPSTYVEKKLMDATITGPAFLCQNGAIWEHRRSGLRKDLPPPFTGKLEGGWSRVQALVEYLPPWEAWLHPKCGLYQEWYMVKWDGDKTDYSEMEHGSGNLLGASWEPDEMLPDSLDVSRLQAKRKWLEVSREREKKQEAEAERDQASKRAAPALPSFDEASVLKKATQYNPKRLKVYDDCFGGHGHCLDFDLPTLLKVDESEIKKSWPKLPEDFPLGHSCAMPPGMCDVACKCMEDWHFGKVLEPRVAHADQQRVAAATAVVKAFCAGAEVIQRGETTGRRYMQHRNQHEDVAPGVACRADRGAVSEALAEAAKGMTEVLQQAMLKLPLSALRHRLGAGALLSLATVFSRRVQIREPQYPGGGFVDGPYRPALLQVVKTAAPTWFSIRAATGEVCIDDAALPMMHPKKPYDVQLKFLNHITGESEVFAVAVDGNAPSNAGSQLDGLAREVARLVKLVPASHRPPLEAVLGSVYDFQAQKCKAPHAGVWIRQVCDAVQLCKASATGHFAQEAAAGS